MKILKDVNMNMKKEHVVLISYKYEYEGTYQSLVMTNLV